MDTGADGQPVDMKEAQVKFKVKQNLIYVYIWWNLVNIETLNGFKSSCIKRGSCNRGDILLGYSEYLVGNIR